MPIRLFAPRELVGGTKFGKCFTTETKVDVKSGKPAKSVKVTDSCFAPKDLLDSLTA